MAKPRIFISSTYYDLKHIRKNLQSFVIGMGYDPILFEAGDIPFMPDLPLDISCYKEIENSHIQILILGGRYGSSTSEPDGDLEIDEDKMYNFYNSITRREYETASEKGIPIFIFVENNVLSEYQTYKLNKKNKSIQYAHVENINVFKLIEDIWDKKTGNFTKGFDNIDDIINWLKLQWAGIFADFLSQERNKEELKHLSSQVEELNAVSNTLKEYSEAIINKIKPLDYKSLIQKEEKKLLELKINSLAKEPLFRHLTKRYKLKNSGQELYDLVKKYKTFSGFLNNSEYEIDIDKEALSKSNIMSHDYKEHRSKLFLFEP